MFVFGDELDVDGHEDRLEPAGLDEHLERYAKAIRRLSRAGYSNVLVTSDHGFFHWTSAENDFVPKPEGEIAWASRRCVIGSGLRGPSTLELPVSRSELCARTPRSVNVFQTRGGLRYFHGGSTLQELVLPVVVAHWPKKTEKVGAVIRPVESITNIGQRLEAAPGIVQQTLGGGVSGSLLSRMVRFRVVHEDTGKALFRSETSTIVPEGGVVALALNKVDGAEAAFGSALAIQLLDADDDEVLATRRAMLRVELEGEWD